jgi:hypothetical protein
MPKVTGRRYNDVLWELAERRASQLCSERMKRSGAQTLIVPQAALPTCTGSSKRMFELKALIRIGWSSLPGTHPREGSESL